MASAINTENLEEVKLSSISSWLSPTIKVPDVTSHIFEDMEQLEGVLLSLVNYASKYDEKCVLALFSGKQTVEETKQDVKNWHVVLKESPSENIQNLWNSKKTTWQKKRAIVVKLAQLCNLSPQDNKNYEYGSVVAFFLVMLYQSRGYGVTNNAIVEMAGAFRRKNWPSRESCGDMVLIFDGIQYQVFLPNFPLARETSFVELLESQTQAKNNAELFNQLFDICVKFKKHTDGLERHRAEVLKFRRMLEVMQSDLRDLETLELNPARAGVDVMVNQLRHAGQLDAFHAKMSQMSPKFATMSLNEILDIIFCQDQAALDAREKYMEMPRINGQSEVKNEPMDENSCSGAQNGVNNGNGVNGSGGDTQQPGSISEMMSDFFYGIEFPKESEEFGMDAAVAAAAAVVNSYEANEAANLEGCQNPKKKKKYE